MNLSKSFFAILFLVGSFASAKVSGPNETWTNLAQVCEKDFAAFEKQMDLTRKDVDFDLSRMTQKEYSTLEAQRDPRLIFVAASWPSDLSEHDEFWKANQDCANVHWEVRKILRSPSADPSEKKERVEDLRNCLLARFNTRTEQTKVIAPYDRLIACYAKRARQK